MRSSYYTFLTAERLINCLEILSIVWLFKYFSQFLVTLNRAKLVAPKLFKDTACSKHRQKNKKSYGAAE